MECLYFIRELAQHTNKGLKTATRKGANSDLRQQAGDVAKQKKRKFAALGMGKQGGDAGAAGPDSEHGDSNWNADEGAERGRPRTRGERQPQHRWGAIMNTQRFEIAPAILNHIDRYGNSGLDFLCDAESFQHSLVSSEEKSVLEWRFALGARWDYIDHIEGRLEGLDSARRLFHFLLIRDLVRLINPKASTRRQNPTTWAALRMLLDQVSYGRRSISRKEAVAKLWHRFGFGEKIDHLTKEFGNGAAIVLAQKLSPDL